MDILFRGINIQKSNPHKNVSIHTSFCIKNSTFLPLCICFLFLTHPDPQTKKTYPTSFLSSGLSIPINLESRGVRSRYIDIQFHMLTGDREKQWIDVEGVQVTEKNYPSSLPRSYSNKINDIKIISYSTYAFKTMQRQPFYDLFWEIQLSLYLNTQEFWHDVETRTPMLILENLFVDQRMEITDCGC